MMYKCTDVQTATDIDRYMLNKHTDIHIYIYIYIYIYTCVHACLFVCENQCWVWYVFGVYMCVWCVWNRCMRTSVVMYACMYVCMCGCEDTNVCMHSTDACVRTHIHTQKHACTFMNKTRLLNKLKVSK